MKLESENRAKLKRQNTQQKASSPKQGSADVAST
ncbi:uncharacterized protein G2W53_026170 [Senna tora]|uniref:Uncharacterized protein n=1 Tax=Senna tora TaxID=362788 RepID=A0A834WEV2_9FABA|nr:uncharacterized protein G2W53_026170 [Senna tora]